MLLKKITILLFLRNTLFFIVIRNKYIKQQLGGYQFDNYIIRGLSLKNIIKIIKFTLRKRN